MQEAAASEADIELQMGTEAAHVTGEEHTEVKQQEEQAPAQPEQPAPQGRRKKKAADKVVDGFAWFGGKVLAGIEFIGEIVANVLGFNESRYQWVMDTMNEQEWEVARRVEEQRQAAAAATSMEGGAEPATAPDTPTETVTETSITSENTSNLNA